MSDREQAFLRAAELVAPLVAEHGLIPTDFSVVEQHLDEIIRLADWLLEGTEPSIVDVVRDRTTRAQKFIDQLSRINESIVPMASGAPIEVRIVSYNEGNRSQIGILRMNGYGTLSGQISDSAALYHLFNGPDLFVLVPEPAVPKEG